MPKLDLDHLPIKTGSIYPAPFAAQMAGRSSVRLGDAAGLTQFGVNLVTLQPGAMSSLRHWHKHEDEFVMVLSGQCTLVQDGGKTPLKLGECAAFPAGVEDGHHLINETKEVASFLVVGSKADPEFATYSDVDLKVEMSGGKANFRHKDGTPYDMEADA
jgi:uncharacterized cupin superfamily protein